MTEQPIHTEAELIDFLHQIDAPAPAALHERIATMVAAEQALAKNRAGRSRPMLSLRWAGAAGAGALAAVAVVLVLVLGAGGGGGPSLTSAAALTLRGATMGAPAQSGSSRSLTAAVDGVAFPYWEESLGWSSVGARADRLDGRTATTVFYAGPGGRRIGYAILSGSAPKLNGGSVAWRGGTAYHLFTLDGARVVAWLRGGHLCVVSGRGVGDATLLRLASWDDRGEARA